ncbi:MAG: hypothetical protein FDX30_10440 [Chlorobium sp.]|nr:MAG: hypothetical protein FDX30_10440 [Chlorobium sp.]
MPETRLEAFTIGNLNYKVLGGVFETEVRLGHEYTEDGSSNSVTTFDINQFYYQKKFDNIGFLAGRKKVRWGVGYSYSPTDLVTQLRNPEDPEDRLGNVKGSDVFQLSFNRENSQVDVAYVPLLDWSFNGPFVKNSRLAIRWYRLMDPYDLSLVSSVDENGKWAGGFNTSVTYGKALELHAEYLYTSSSNRQYPDTSIDPAGFSIPYFEGRTGGYHEILVGAQYTFENNLNMTLEYLFTSAGYSDEEFKAYSAHVKYLNSSYPMPAPDLSLAGLYESASNFVLPLRTHYLFARLYHPEVLHTIALETFSYISLCDGSGFFVFQPKYEKAKNYELYLRLKKFWGKSGSEFGLVPYDFSAVLGVSLFLGS